MMYQGVLYSPEGMEAVRDDHKIRLGHVIDFTAEQRQYWQELVSSNHIVQPLDQLSEYAYTPEEVKEDRYRGCTIRFRDLIDMEDHGIYAEIYEVFYDVIRLLRLLDCSISYSIGEYANPLEDTEITLKIFKYKAINRQVNHILNILDRITVKGRTALDDTSVVRFFDELNKEELDELMDIAEKHDSVRVRTLILEYRNTHYESHDALDELMQFIE